MINVNNRLIMFGGILEVTKESDEVFVYDINSSNWTILDHHAPGNHDLPRSLSGTKEDLIETRDEPFVKKDSSHQNFKKGKHTQS